MASSLPGARGLVRGPSGGAGPEGSAGPEGPAGAEGPGSAAEPCDPGSRGRGIRAAASRTGLPPHMFLNVLVRDAWFCVGFAWDLRAIGVVCAGCAPARVRGDS